MSSSDRKMLRADRARLVARLEALSQIGRNAEGGVDRIAYSDADIAGRAHVTELMRAANLEVRVDPAGNILGRRTGLTPDLPAILFGSHVDSVPRGGDYDGPLGVLGALEVIEVLEGAAHRTRHPLEVIVFTDEEGGLTGSRAFIGDLGPEALAVVGSAGLTIAEGIRRVGGDPGRIAEARVDPQTVRAFLELHIEQGSVLEDAGIDIGVVEGIVGIRRWEITVEGAARHAGTTPMNRRRDALLTASEITLAANRLATTLPGAQVATVGYLRTEPGFANVIPGRAVMILELRDLRAETIDRLFRSIRSEATTLAAVRGTRVRFDELDVAAPPVPTDPGIQARIAVAADELELSHRHLPSGAGHDAQNLARIAPTGMIFVPSVDGVSHAPTELTAPEDLVNGVNVLLQTILAVDEE